MSLVKLRNGISLVAVLHQFKSLLSFIVLIKENKIKSKNKPDEYNLDGSLGIDGLAVMKLTFGIKVPGTRTRIRRESKVLSLISSPIFPSTHPSVHTHTHMYIWIIITVILVFL